MERGSRQGGGAVLCGSGSLAEVDGLGTGVPCLFFV